MKLPKGITGFFKSNEDEVPQLDEKWLKQQAYLCSGSGYIVQEIIPPATSTNFYRLVFVHSVSGKHVVILVNSSYPFFAGVTVDSVWMQFVFVGIPDVLKTCLEPGLTYLTPELLNTEFVNENLTELGEEELKQITYWKCSTFGEVIFNGFD